MKHLEVVISEDEEKSARNWRRLSDTLRELHQKEQDEKLRIKVKGI